MKYPLLFIALVAAVSGTAVAQTGSISGTVIDRDTQQPIEGAMVLMKGTSYGIMTKANGTYLILGVPPGVYTLIAKRAGYEPVDISGVPVLIDVRQTLGIEMRPSSTRVSEVAATQGQAQTTQPGRFFTVQPNGQAVQSTEPATKPGTDLFSRCLIAPEFVMAHQREIELLEAQRTRLMSETAAAQAQFTRSQWTISGEQQKLEQILKTTAVDEAAALKQLDRMLTIERELKITQMTLLLRVKNTLTAKQQDVLNVLSGGQLRRPRAADGSLLAPCGM